MTNEEVIYRLETELTILESLLSFKKHIHQDSLILDNFRISYYTFKELSKNLEYKIQIEDFLNNVQFEKCLNSTNKPNIINVDELMDLRNLMLGYVLQCKSHS